MSPLNLRRRATLVTPRMEFHRGKVQTCAGCGVSGQGDSWTFDGKKHRCGLCSKGRG